MKQIIDTILVPYDGTKSSDKAFKNTLEIAKNHSAKIIILICIKEQFSYGFFKSKGDKKMLKKQKIIAEKKINDLKEIAKKSEISLRSHICVCDSISTSILNYAKKHKVDLIAMSKTSLATNAEKLYYESTVEHVFKHTPCSFLYIR